MDDITRRVAAQYDRFPYPMDPTQIRADAFVDWILAQVERRAPRAGWHVLDAGCGTGSGAVPVAEMYPQAQVVGVDVSAAALEYARATAARAGADNLRLVVGDLMDRDSLPAAPGGYDVIYASGVLHHLSEPAQGLSHLTSLLAPDGVLVLMVYNSYGRAPVWRFAQAMDLLHPDRSDYEHRVPLARALLSALPPCAVNGPPWDDAAHVPDNELVDRYLHVQDRGYTVPELFGLLESAGLSFLRWLEPRPWSPVDLLGPGPASELLLALPPVQRYTALDLLFDHPSLTLLATRGDALPRKTPRGDALLAATVAFNPQVALATVSRRLGAHAFVTDVEVTVRGLAPQRLTSAQAALAQVATEPMVAVTLLEKAQATLRMDETESRAALAELVRQEVLFLPQR